MAKVITTPQTENERDIAGKHDAASRSRNWEARTMDTFDCRRCGECQTQRQPEPFYCPTCDAAELARKDELLKAYRELVKRLDRPEPLPTCEALRIGLTAPHREIVMEEIARDIANAQAKVAKLEAGR